MSEKSQHCRRYDLQRHFSLTPCKTQLLHRVIPAKPPSLAKPHLSIKPQQRVNSIFKVHHQGKTSPRLAQRHKQDYRNFLAFPFLGPAQPSEKHIRKAINHFSLKHKPPTLVVKIPPPSFLSFSKHSPRAKSRTSLWENAESGGISRKPGKSCLVVLHHMFVPRGEFSEKQNRKSYFESCRQPKLAFPLPNRLEPAPTTAQRSANDDNEE